MKMDLGDLKEITIIKIKNPKTSVVAKVKWVFEKADLKWGTILKSKHGGFWVQVPKFCPSGRWITPLKISGYDLENHLFAETLKKYQEITDQDFNGEDIDELMREADI